MLSSNCSIVRGPRIIDVIIGLARHQARANCEGATPFGLTVGGKLLRNGQAFVAQLRLPHSLVVAGGPAAGGECFARLVFGRQDAAGQRTVADDAQVVRLAQRQQFDLDIAIHEVI